MIQPDNVDMYQYWTGRGGIASKIKRDIGMPRTYPSKRLLPIFEKALECHLNDECFDPTALETRCGHRSTTIRIDSKEAQMIADYVESGLSIRRT